MIFKLVRHAESEANVGKVDGALIGNCNIALTEKGEEQAWDTGYSMGWNIFEEGLLYCSPYLRTRQTIAKMIAGGRTEYKVPPRVYEDPRLREVDWGYHTYGAYDDVLEELKDVHGPFYTRREQGESCADCYDRISSFLDSMWRQLERKKLNKVIIVSHGLTIRTFVMRFMHLTVEQFGLLRNPKNCDIITISNESDYKHDSQYFCGKWGVSGLRLRNEFTDLFGTEKNNGPKD